jgi:alpha-beta hydrolase superfamily lysophospholipase
VFRLYHLIRRHPWRSAALAVLLPLLTAFAALNFLAYHHAHSMTHFVEDDGWCGDAERLSLWDKAGVLVGGVKIRRPRYDHTPYEVGLAYQTHTFAGPAGTLEGWLVPHPRARGSVLLFHGYTGCKARLLPEARAFHDLGYECFILDFRGSGGSEGNATTIGYREAEDVACAVEHIRQRSPRLPLVLFGQSMGAAAVLRAVAVEGVEADALVLEAPFADLLTAVKARFAMLGVPAFPAAQLLVFWGGLQHGFNGFSHRPADYARCVREPALLLYGDDDRRVASQETAAVFANLAGPKRLHTFAGLGHESFVARRPDEWKEQVAVFLDETTDATGRQ